MKMERQIAPSVRMLNGFLSVVVVVLVGILLAVVASMLLWAVGIF